jgi:Zn-dependent protease with chaperone function
MTSHSRDESILAAVDVRVEPVRLTFFYQAGLFAVAILMLLLPVIYIALIVCVGYGVWYYSEYGLVIFEAHAVPFIIQLLGYVVPLVAGPTVVVFMIKPLFAPKLKTPSARMVTRQEQPLLYQLAEKLAHAVNAPVPTKIAIDMEVNASASFRRGVRSLFGNDLVLTVGLPLVGGLNLTQLAGVLAHEFGHFSQSFAMRFGYIISTLNEWFARVVYERDAWDMKLEEIYQRPGSAYVLLIVSVSRLLVWLSRWLLRVLMVLGQGVSSFLSRQMEYNADEHQAWLTGSEACRTTHLRIQVLSVAMEQALASLRELWGERRLVDDLVPLVLLEADTLASDPEMARQIEASLMEAKTGLFDTHPAPRERLTRVSKYNSAAQVEDSRFIPAYAGMNRFYWAVNGQVVGVPRVRGDEPVTLKRPPGLTILAVRS